jgi:hypothetical protein
MGEENGQWRVVQVQPAARTNQLSSRSAQQVLCGSRLRARQRLAYGRHQGRFVVAAAGPDPDEETLGAVLAEGVGPPRHDEAFGLLEQVGAGHPQVAHGHLPAIGATPPCQNLPVITPMFLAAR